MKVLLSIWFVFTVNLTTYGQSISSDKKVVLSKNKDSELSIGEIAGTKDVVLVFATHDCPYNERYKGRLETLASDFEGTQFIVVNSGDKPAEALNNLIDAAFVWDKENYLKRLLGARKSPEVFLMKNLNSSFRLIYAGSIDDDPQSSGDVSNAYLRDALTLLEKGMEPERKKTIPTGCILR